MSDKPGRITAWSVTSEEGETKYYLPMPDGELKEISREEANQLPGRWLNGDPEPEKEKNNKG